MRLCAFQVIHYEVPSVSENFIHRSGRTGRAGRRGKVILIYTDNQAKDVLKIERDIGCKFEEVFNGNYLCFYKNYLL